MGQLTRDGSMNNSNDQNIKSTNNRVMMKHMYNY